MNFLSLSFSLLNNLYFRWAEADVVVYPSDQQIDIGKNSSSLESKEVTTPEDVEEMSAPLPNDPNRNLQWGNDAIRLKKKLTKFYFFAPIL